MRKNRFYISKRAERETSQTRAAEEGIEQAEAGELLLELRPSRWNFFWYYVFFFLIFTLIVAWWKRASEILRVYTDRVVLEKGILNKSYKEVFLADIRAIDVEQKFGQRILGYGDILIATAGTEGYELEVKAVPKPKLIRDLIIQLRQELSGTDD